MARTQLTGTEILDESVKGDDIDESTLTDTLVPFNEAGFSATNIHDAIIEARVAFNENRILTGYKSRLTLTDSRGNVLLGGL